MGYYAEKSLSLELETYRGVTRNKTVILIDEVLTSEKFDKFFDYCRRNQIITIGFVRYEDDDEITFS